MDDNFSFESVMRGIQSIISKKKSERVVQTTLDQFWSSKIFYTCSGFLCGIWHIEFYGTQLFPLFFLSYRGPSVIGCQANPTTFLDILVPFNVIMDLVRFVEFPGPFFLQPPSPIEIPFL